MLTIFGHFSLVNLRQNQVVKITRNKVPDIQRCSQLEKMKKILLIIIVITTTVHKGIACSCGDYLLDLPIKEMGWTQSKSEGISSISDIIFSGTLLEYHPIEEERLDFLYKKTVEYRYELVFKLIKSYKGDSHDTIRIRTNRGNDACGFGAKENTDCLIFANKNGNGFYYTYRSDCCKSISKEQDEKRYKKYIDFLESIVNMKDGDFNYKQTRTYWNGGYPNQSDTLDLISYQIRNGKFEGEWKITDRRGRIIEQGQYRNGQKIGTWKIVSIYESEYEGMSTETELVEYYDGKRLKSEIVIEDEEFNFELGKYETVRIQKLNKEYEYK